MRDIYSQFTDWVKLQPRDAEYDYTECKSCAFFQFLDAAGYNPSGVAPGFWRAKSDPLVHIPFPRGIESAVFQEPWTFGALSDRLARPAQAGADHG